MPVWCLMFQQTLDGSARGEIDYGNGIHSWCTKGDKNSSFMDTLKFLELAKRYSDKVPQTVDEMMIRLDDFVHSEEAIANT
ncbi:hypothetical protein Tco_0526068 [Tanacetum coccineum]